MSIQCAPPLFWISRNFKRNRYLLINGRSHYARLFTSQETWLLFFIQVLFLSFQSLCLRHLGTDVNNNQAVFESINTRHSGFSAVRLQRQNAGILVLFLVMMFLAPSPFVVVLHRTERDEGGGGGGGGVSGDLRRSRNNHTHRIDNDEDEDDEEDDDEHEFRRGGASGGLSSSAAFSMIHASSATSNSEVTAAGTEAAVARTRGSGVRGGDGDATSPRSNSLMAAAKQRRSRLSIRNSSRQLAIRSVFRSSC